MITDPTYGCDDDAVDISIGGELENKNVYWKDIRLLRWNLSARELTQ